MQRCTGIRALVVTETGSFRGADLLSTVDQELDGQNVTKNLLAGLIF